jgi:uncharacterized membrane protein
VTVWISIAATVVGCYLLKLAGLLAPQRVLADPRIRRFSELVPIALLTALVAVQTLGHGTSLELSVPRLGGLATAIVALLARIPFLGVLLAAALAAAGLRLLGS